MKKEFDPRDFEDWCREVLPELATFKAACDCGNRTRAGIRVRKRGPNVGKSISRLEKLFRKRLDGGRIDKPRIVHAPSGRRKKVFDTDWVAVGDSASSYDPLSGRGIFKALSQGKAAAQAIDARLRGDRATMDQYAAKIEREFEQYARQRRSYYSLEQRWRDQPFWQRRGTWK